MQQLDDYSKLMPLYYSWVNITCHPEWLKYFEVDPFQVPSVVFYFPEKERQATLIGKFDLETIQEHQDRFMKGKLPTWVSKTKASAMKMEEKDCTTSLHDDDDMSEKDAKSMEEEILREIMEEQAEREKKQKEDTKKSKKAGSKKGKNKKKGKKGRKDEL